MTVYPQTAPLDTPQPRPRRWLLRVLTGFAYCYSLLLIITLLLRVFVGESWVVVAFLNSALHLFLMLSVLLLPLLLVLRRWRAAALVAPAFVLFVVWYGAFFLPQTVTAAPDAPTIRLFTYNIHAERFLFEPMAAVIRQSDADVVVLQEMTHEAAAYFDAALADLYPYRALHPFNNYYYGRGILSKYPILEDHSWPETEPVTVRLQRVSLDMNGQPITVYNFHAPVSYPIWGEGYNNQPRAEQITDLINIAARETAPTLLLGDFNTTFLDDNYQGITRHFADTYHEVGWGLGFTNPDTTYENARESWLLLPPYNRLDYIFHDPHFTALESRVWPDSGGSDHLPVYAVLAFNEE